MLLCVVHDLSYVPVRESTLITYARLLASPDICQVRLDVQSHRRILSHELLLLVGRLCQLRLHNRVEHASILRVLVGIWVSEWLLMHRHLRRTNISRPGEDGVFRNAHTSCERVTSRGGAAHSSNARGASPIAVITGSYERGVSRAEWAISE